jgi:hypothetical protein
VLDLYLQRGDFWNEIKAMRERWNITAVRGFPSRPAWYPHPFPDTADETERRARYNFDKELHGLEHRVVPERFRQGFFSDWDRFLAVCVLHDPPDDRLIEFAAQGGPYPEAVWDPLGDGGVDDPAGDRPTADLQMVAHPVKWLRDPDEESFAEVRYFKDILHAIGERHLAPLGIDVWELFYEVWENCPEIRKEYQEARKKNRAKPYIEVNNWTTDNDVRNGLRLIRQALPRALWKGAQSETHWSRCSAHCITTVMAGPTSR